MASVPALDCPSLHYYLNDVAFLVLLMVRILTLQDRPNTSLKAVLLYITRREVLMKLREMYWGDLWIAPCAFSLSWMWIYWAHGISSNVEIIILSNLHSTNCGRINMRKWRMGSAFRTTEKSDKADHEVSSWTGIEKVPQSGEAQNVVRKVRRDALAETEVKREWRRQNLVWIESCGDL